MYLTQRQMHRLYICMVELERRRSQVQIPPKADHFFFENHLLWVHDLPLNLIHAKCFHTLEGKLTLQWCTYRVRLC